MIFLRQQQRDDQSHRSFVREDRVTMMTGGLNILFKWLAYKHTGKCLEFWCIWWLQMNLDIIDACSLCHHFYIFIPWVLIQENSNMRWDDYGWNLHGSRSLIRSNYPGVALHHGVPRWQLEASDHYQIYPDVSVWNLDSWWLLQEKLDSISWSGWL